MATSLTWHGSAPRPRRTHFAVGCSRGAACRGLGLGPTAEFNSRRWDIGDLLPAVPSLRPPAVHAETPAVAPDLDNAARDRDKSCGEFSSVEVTATAHQPCEPRSDVEILFRQELDRHPHFRGRSDWVRARFRRGTLRLSGTLPSFYLKQVAQAVAHRVPSVARVINRIEVRDLVSCENRLESWNWNPGK